MNDRYVVYVKNSSQDPIGYLNSEGEPVNNSHPGFEFLIDQIRRGINRSDRNLIIVKEGTSEKITLKMLWSGIIEKKVKKHLTDEEKRDILDKYSRGVKISKLMKEYNRTYPTIKKVIDTRNL